MFRWFGGGGRKGVVAPQRKIKRRRTNIANFLRVNGKNKRGGIGGGPDFAGFPGGGTWGGNFLKND